jgi:cytoskeletal protein CcmA (bactofilin family)
MGLFSKTKPGPAPASGGRSANETAFLGSKLTVRGKVSGNGNLIIMGKLEGELDLNGELVVAPSAVVDGEIQAAMLTLSGNVTGHLTAREKVSLEKTATVSGRLTTQRLSVAEGASFNGEIEMKKAPEEQLPSKGSDKK